MWRPPTRKAAEAKVDEACKKLLANQIMEKYSFSIEELAGTSYSRSVPMDS